MKLKWNYIVFFHNDRGSDNYEFMTKEELKAINSFSEYVQIYKIEKILSMEEKRKLGMIPISERTD